MKVRVLALLSALAMWLVAAMPSAASAQDNTYLALGDSVAFGFSPLLDPHNANNFIGYPAIVGERLDMNVVNASCSGEATGGFIDPAGLDNACRFYRANWPLHVSYTGTQLAFAINFLKTHRSTELVSLGLDANDFFRLTSGPGTPWPPSTCFVPDLVTYFATCAVKNLTTIFRAIRESGEYSGKLVVVLYYALNYGDPNSVFVSHDLLNKAMITAGEPFHVRLADGFEAFKAAAAPFGGDSCKAGLLIVVKALPLTCDVHPTPTGRDLLAGEVVEAIHDGVA